jgi:ubiquinone/menaquinone biosynthesis C-methylase UbiE
MMLDLYLSEAEKQLLLVLGRAARRGLPPDRSSLTRLAQVEFGPPLDWTDAYASLEQRALIHCDNGHVHLTERGDRTRAEVHKRSPYWRYTFDRLYAEAEGSAAHALFCERVYGRDLGQQGMADMEQIQILVDVLDLDSHSRALDLGCGAGRIAEHIADQTGAQMIGVDLSPVGIRQAQARTADKRDRLAFYVGNIQRLHCPPASFDRVLLIDVLHYCSARAVLEQIKRIVTPGGLAGIFFSQWVQPGESKARLRPEGTVLARALRACGLTFWTWDLSAHEIAHWTHKLDVLVRMRPAFEAEGKRWLYEYRLAETRSHTRTLGRHTRSRYLYQIPL